MIMVDVLQLMRQTTLKDRDRASKFLSRPLEMSNQVADKAYSEFQTIGFTIRQK
jgi:hypothetical protein